MKTFIAVALGMAVMAFAAPSFAIAPGQVYKGPVNPHFWRVWRGGVCFVAPHTLPDGTFTNYQCYEVVGNTQSECETQLSGYTTNASHPIHSVDFCHGTDF